MTQPLQFPTTVSSGLQYHCSEALSTSHLVNQQGPLVFHDTYIVSIFQLRCVVLFQQPLSQSDVSILKHFLQNHYRVNIYLHTISPANEGYFQRCSLVMGQMSALMNQRINICLLSKRQMFQLYVCQIQNALSSQE